MLEIKTFFDKESGTLTHLVLNPKNRDAVLIDPVMDFHVPTFSTSSKSADEVLQFCREKELRVHFVLETHVHADHLSGSQFIKAAFPKAKLAIGQEITEVQSHFAEFYDLGPSFPRDGSQFDLLYKTGSELDAHSFSVKPLHTPGHTRADYTLQVDGHAFTGDILFAPDLGTGRCDFPGGSAKALYESVKQTLYTLPPETILHPAHDYPEGRELRTAVPLKEQMKSNVRLNAQTTEEEFLAFRKKRDQELAAPRLILPSLFVNIHGGRLPEKRKNGRAYVSIPFNSKL